MNKLFQQIVKFGIVGGFCFLIDIGVYNFLCKIGVHYLIAGFFGFLISVVANYILSFKFVFERKEDMDRRKEFVIFVALSAGGLVINEVILYICMDVIYANWNGLRSLVESMASFGTDIGGKIKEEFVLEPHILAALASKIVATGIVMVYNFVTRKKFLEKKEEPGTEKEQ